MLKFILKRLLMLLPVILGISFVVYSIISLTPGDPAQLILGADADPALLAAKRESLGLNTPFLVRYLKYIGGVLHGDFGTSYRTGLPVVQELALRLPKTMIIAFGGIGLSVLFGVPLGMASAIRQYSFIDYFARMVAVVLTAVPQFWMGLILVQYFVLKLHVLPATGADSWRNYVLPIFTLGAAATATLTRTTRSSMLEVIRQEYITTAKAKGVPEKRTIFKHMIRNGILPVVTIVGMNVGVQIGSAVVIENVFAIPGLGSLIITSVRMKDMPMAISSIIVVAFFIGVMNMIVDILYAYIDPRIKSRMFGNKKRKTAYKRPESEAAG